MMTHDSGLLILGHPVVIFSRYLRRK